MFDLSKEVLPTLTKQKYMYTWVKLEKSGWNICLKLEIFFTAGVERCCSRMRSRSCAVLLFWCSWSIDTWLLLSSDTARERQRSASKDFIQSRFRGRIYFISILFRGFVFNCL